MKALFRAGSVIAMALVSASAFAAEKKYDQGASDTEIRIGQTVPYSGPASYGGVIGRIQVPFFEELNAAGGINGRKVKFISLDDGYSPPKTVEATRRLVESEGVLATWFSMGTGPQLAVQKYLHAKGVPQLMVSTGSPRWNDPKKFPLTVSALGLYSTEAKAFGRWLLQHKPDAKIAILFQNDDLGREYVADMKRGLGDQAKGMVVAEASYDITDPTIDSQMVKLANSGANVFYNVTVGKFVSQSLRKTSELGWKPMHYLVGISTSRPLLQAAGLEKAKGVRSLVYVRQPTDKEWVDEPLVKEYQAFRAKHAPGVDEGDAVGFMAWSGARMLVDLLQRSGDDLTRANLMKQLMGMSGYVPAHFLPGITYDISTDDYEPVRAFYFAEFDGETWVREKEQVKR